jgi:hypothetical protein
MIDFGYAKFHGGRTYLRCVYSIYQLKTLIPDLTTPTQRRRKDVTSNPSWKRSDGWVTNHGKLPTRATTLTSSMPSLLSSPSAAMHTSVPAMVSPNIISGADSQPRRSRRTEEVEKATQSHVNIEIDLLKRV